MDKKGVKQGPKKQQKKSEDALMEKKLNDKIKEMETEFDTNEHLVIDLGNAYTKIGFSGEDLPKDIIPSLYARYHPTEQQGMNKDLGAYDQKMDIFGYEAIKDEYKEGYDLFELTGGDHKTPTSKEYFEFLKDALENKTMISANDYDVIVNIAPIRSDDNIRAYGHLFIEDLGFKAMAIINSASLSLYATGRTSGLSVLCGEKITYTAPCYEGFPLFHAINKNKIGGKDITNIYIEGIKKNEIPVDTGNIEILREIKEKTCFVPYENNAEYYLKNDDDIISKEARMYKLPDETIVEIPKECRIRAAEILFTPQEQLNSIGLVPLILDSGRKCEVIDKRFRDLLYGNIVLSGGTSMMSGFPNRIYMDLQKHFEEQEDRPEVINVVAENNRHISKWIGMSMISSMSAFDKLFIKKAEYQELGEERFAEVARIF